jgi:hypothetical protein
MFDDLGRLRGNPRLQQLLAHYADACAAGGDAWQDRLVQLDGACPQELTQLHGELIVIGPDGDLYVAVRNYIPNVPGQGLGGEVMRFDPVTGAFLGDFVTDPYNCGPLPRVANVPW